MSSVGGVLRVEKMISLFLFFAHCRISTYVPFFHVFRGKHSRRFFLFFFPFQPYTCSFSLCRYLLVHIGVFYLSAFTLFRVRIFYTFVYLLYYVLRFKSNGKFSEASLFLVVYNNLGKIIRFSSVKARSLNYVIYIDGDTRFSFIFSLVSVPKYLDWIFIAS